MGKVKLLLDCGANATVRDKDNNTLLHIAAAKGHADVVRVLLDNVPGNALHDRNGDGDIPWNVAQKCAVETWAKRCEVKEALNPGYLAVLKEVQNKEGAGDADALLGAVYTPGADVNAQVCWPTVHG